MGKYDNVLKSAQIRRLVEEKRYRKALQLMDTIDIKSVKNALDLNNFGEVYIKTERFEDARNIYLRLYEKNKTKRVVHRLIFLSIRRGSLDEAENYYQDYLTLNPSESDRLILRYRIDKAKGVPRNELIPTLEQLKREDYMEEWAYELAKLYHKEGMKEECIRECSDIILWFGEGEIVDRAILLKQHHTGVMDDSALTLRKREKLNDPLRINDPLFDDTTPLIPLEEISAASKANDISIPVKPEDESEPEASAIPEELRITIPEEQLQEFARHSQSGTGITQDLAREISLIYESEQRQLGEKAVTVEPEEEFPNTESLMLTPEEEAIIQSLDPVPSEPVQLDVVTNRMEQALDNMFGKKVADNMQEITSGQEDAKDTSEDSSAPYTEKTDYEPVIVPAGETEPTEETDTAVNMVSEEAVGADEKTQETEAVKETLEDSDEKNTDTPDGEKGIDPRIVGRITAELAELKGEPLVPITTMAIHKSFRDILKLVEADPEQCHFVLIGANPDTTIEVTKKIAKVIGDKGQIHASQIARITGDKLNQMDLIANAGMLRQSCLLVEQASALSIQSVTSLVKLMDDFADEIVVVLADESETLEDLFSKAYALNRRFKYVIDITGYEPEDYTF